MASSRRPFGATVFPAIPRSAQVVGVMLMGTPMAVASSVVSDRLTIEPDFVRSLLVLTTAASVVTLPLWLFFLM